MSNASSFVDGYLAVWDTNDFGRLGTVFAPDAVYRESPHDAEPLQGIDAIAAYWREAADAPGTWGFDWVVEIETEHAAAIRGVTSYADGRTYDNLWLVRFDDDGLATEFTDWYMRRAR